MVALTRLTKAMDESGAEPSSIKSVELFTKFNVNRDDSALYDEMKQWGIHAALV